MKFSIQWVSKLYPVILFTTLCKNLSLFVSDFCKDIYRQFLTRHTYLISCSTGKGKSYMVTNHIIPLAFKQKKKVLLLVNRTKLADQYLKDIRCTVVEGIVSYNPICHSLVNDFDQCLLILTYQQLDFMLANNLEATLSEIDKYDIVVADEVHYWLHDSTFNPGSRLSAEAVLMFLCAKTRYLMSATMDDIKPILLEPGKYMNPLFTPYNRFYSPISKETVTCAEYDLWAVHNYEYVMPADYSYLDVHYFNKIDVIIDIIIESNTNSKWLIFVNNKKRGKEIVEKIKALYKLANPNCKNTDIAAFISSDYRDIEEEDMKDVMNEITENENIKAKVLVSTSVLDNGISLKSKDLLNIVICTDNEVSFKQMLGRKRLTTSSEKVNLFIPAMDAAFFIRRRKRIEDIFFDVDQICFADFDKQMTSIIYTKGDSRSDSFRSVAFPFVESANSVCHSHFIINELSRHQLRLLHASYKRIIDRFETDGDKAFIKEQLDWLGLSYDEKMWINDNSNQRYKKLFDDNLVPFENQKLDETALAQLTESIKQAVCALVDKARSNRITISSINEALNIVLSDFRIDKKSFQVIRYVSENTTYGGKKDEE